MPPTLSPAQQVELGERVALYGADAGDGAGPLTAGDFNGDGAQDIALAAAFADGPDNARADTGEVYLFFGPFSPGETRDVAAGDQDVTVFGAAAGDQLGRASAAGDLNGDGLDDLAIAAPFGDGPDGQRQDAGNTYLLAGARSWPDSIDLAGSDAGTVIFGAGSEDLAGFSLATGDADGDRRDDLLLGAFWADGPNDAREDGGEAYLILGADALPESIDLARGAAAVTVLGAGAGDRLAETLVLGDVDGDGVDDLVLSSTFAAGSDNDREDAGEVHVILGGELEPLYDLAETAGDLTVLGSDNGDQIGHSSAVGDVNGDGDGDLLLGAVSADGPANAKDLAGEIYVVNGSPATTATVDTLTGEELALFIGADTVDRLGRAVAAGDLNGDGLDDLLLAASGGDGMDGSLKDCGELYVIYGRPDLSGVFDTAVWAPDLTVYGQNAGDAIGLNAFGRPSLLSRDIDGDGLDDVLVATAADGPDGDKPDAGGGWILFARRR